jgi:hypothetical protein
MIRHTFQIIMMLTMCSQIYAGDRVKARREAARLAALQPQQQESHNETLQLQKQLVEQKAIQPTIQETASAAIDAIFSPGKRKRDELAKSSTPLTEKKAKKRRELTELEAQVQEETARLEALRQQFNEESSKLSIAGTQAQQEHAFKAAQTETAKQAAKRTRRESKRLSKALAPNLKVMEILQDAGLADEDQSLVANFIEQLRQTSLFKKEQTDFIADIKNARIQDQSKIKRDGITILQKIANIKDEDIAIVSAYDFISGLMAAVGNQDNADVSEAIYEIYAAIEEITNPGVKKASERYTQKSILDSIQKELDSTAAAYTTIKTEAENSADLFPITYLLLLPQEYFYPTQALLSTPKNFFNNKIFPFLNYANKDTLSALLHHVLAHYSSNTSGTTDLVTIYRQGINKALSKATSKTKTIPKYVGELDNYALSDLIYKQNNSLINTPYLRKLTESGWKPTKAPAKLTPEEEADLRKEELQKLGSKNANLPNSASALELAVDPELYSVAQDTDTTHRRSKRRSSTSDIPTQRQSTSSANLTKIKTAIGGSVEINKDALKNALLQRLGNNPSKA